MTAKALRPIAKLHGVSYAAGSEIPDAVIARMSPQVVKALVNRGDLEVEGMEAAGATAGISQHLGARIDKHNDMLKAGEVAHADNAKRIAALEAAVANLTAGKAVKQTRRQARQETEQE